jgi:3-phenylpropionate/trans-cinnamate dioxygenase ferredoxin reductase component
LRWSVDGATDIEKYLILGAGLAGVSAAEALRKEGFEGSITVAGEEPHRPYDRPPLSKHYLRGETPLEKIALKPADFYDSNTIELALETRATRIDVEDRRVHFDGEPSRLDFDRLLIATGSRNRPLDVPGNNLEGVLELRTVADADRIRDEAQAGGHAVLVGMGFIGSEVAASLRQSGLVVTVIEALQIPFERLLGHEIGKVIEGIHRDHGIDVRLGEAVVGFVGAGRVEGVITGEGKTIEADFVVVGAGVRPATALAEQAGLEVEDGIIVDESCRTSAPGIYAAGDVTRHFHPIAGRHIRVEHWQNALKQGQAAAASMLDQEHPYREVHWFWSDQYEFNIQYAGFHSEWDRLVLRGILEERKFVGFYLKDSKVVASVAINNGRDLRRAKELIRVGAVVDPELLADPDVDLRKIV